MDSEDIYANVQCRDIEDSTGPQTQNHKQDEGNDQEHRSRRCVLLVLTILGFICALLLLVITLQHVSINAERDQLKTYKNTVEELNHTISGLQHSNTDLKTHKHQLETRVSDLSALNNQLQNNFNSLNRTKLELENNIASMSPELKRACFQNGLFMSTDAMSWSDSRRFCRDRGADLVIIKSEEKQRFISSLVKENMWIGLSDIQTERTMKWVDNSPLNQGFWLKGEPNDLGGHEDCIELISTEPVLNNWNDLPCSEKKKGICEK